jgi:hypothetical protein
MYTPEEEETERIYNAAIEQVKRWENIKTFIEFVCSKINLYDYVSTNGRVTPLNEYSKAFEDFCNEQYNDTSKHGRTELGVLSNFFKSSSFINITTAGSANPRDHPKVVDIIRQALLVKHPDYYHSEDKVQWFKETIFGKKQIGGGRRRRRTHKRRRSNRRRRHTRYSY